MGQTFMTWLILQQFLAHFCYFEVLLDGRLNPLRDESVTLSGPNTRVRIRRERCCNTRVENHIQQGDTHSEQVKATTHHNKPPTTPQNCSPEADVSSHTNQNSFDFILLIQCLTSGPNKPHRDQFLSLDQLKRYRLHWADLSPTLGPRCTHSVTWTEFFYSCLLLSEAYLTLVRLFQRVWLVRCENARPSLRSTERLNRLQLDCFVFGCFFFPFLFNGNCFLHRNKV